MSNGSFSDIPAMRGGLAMGSVGLLGAYQWSANATGAAPVDRDLLVETGKTLVTLPQNWSDAEAVWFYNAPQGSMIMPLLWYAALESSASEVPFNAPEHIRALGYLPRKPNSADNKYGLPVGFVQDRPYSDGRPALGLTCAACHTTQLDYGDKTYLVDGAPTLGDLATFLHELQAALEATASDDEKFGRFARRVLGAADNAGERETLSSRLRAVVRERRDYLDRNLAGPQGVATHGRIDALGIIMNEITVRFMGNTQNQRAANAPVSYPCVWDAPQHDKVQWNGAVKNTKLLAVIPPFHTRDVGALGRNAGEVLGVFGYVDVSEPRGLLNGYDSSVNHASLILIEDTLKTLWSPPWPTNGLPPVDRQRAAQGRVIYVENCASCHGGEFDRTDPSRKVKAVMQDVGTDPLAWSNFAYRKVKTEALEGRQIGIGLPGISKKFGAVADGVDVIEHVVIRTLLRPADAPEPSGDLPPLETIWNKPAPPLTMMAHLPRPEGDEEVKRGGVYKARPLNGIWATAPYLHNGSVPTLADLLKRPTQRPKKFHVGNRTFDPVAVGFVQTSGPTEVDTGIPGNGNEGHVAGTNLSETEKQALLEYLKTL